MSSSGRSPNFARFILTGAVLGFALGGFVAITGVLEGPVEHPGNYTPTAAVGYLGLMGALVFGLTAGVVAVLLDRRR